METLSFSVMMLLLLGGSRLSRGDQNDCPCPKIPPWPQTEPPPENCYEIDTRFRYICVEGYVRKAGTSSLIKCKETDGAAQWSTPTLECIPDPTITTTQSTRSTTKTEPRIQPPNNTVTTKSYSTYSTTEGSVTPSAVQTEKSTTSASMAPSSASQKEVVKAVSIIVSLVIICALLGIMFLLYRRKSNNNNKQLSAEEVVPMNDGVAME